MRWKCRRCGFIFNGFGECPACHSGNTIEITDQGTPRYDDFYEAKREKPSKK